MATHKLSSYLVISPIFFDKTAGYNKNIVLSTRTTEMVVLHSDYVDIIQNGMWEILPQNTIEMLIENKFIVPINEDELDVIILENKASIKNDKALSFVVQPTSQCQMGCDYCGQEHTNNKLSSDLKNKIIARYSNLINAKTYSKVYVSWFGAEPLIAMSHIEELSLKFIEIAIRSETNYGARVVTNGLNLTFKNFHNLVENLGVDFIEITLDGTSEFHDKRRGTKKGIPTFDKIFFNILEIVNNEYYEQKKFRLSIRCNVDKRNYEGVEPLIELLAQNNLQNKISFYVAPIHSWGNDAHQLSLEKSEFAKKEIEWIILLKKRGFNIPYLPKLKPIVCMAVKENAELIDAFGNVYNCTEVSYVPSYDNGNYLLGNLILNNVDEGKRKFSDFNDLINNNKLPCTSCNMLPVCGGGCPKSWEEGNIACPSNKFNIKEKLLLYYAEQRGAFVN